MVLCIENALGGDDLATVRAMLADVPFAASTMVADGEASAATVHEQSTASEATARAATIVGEAIMRNGRFRSHVVPKHISSIIFSRHGEGMADGKHVDAPIMHGARADMSFTVFLNEPSEYDGGELIIEQPQGYQAIKLAAGQLAAYPSTTFNQVTEVTRGVRLCAVGWVRSLIRDPAARDLLADISSVRKTLSEKGSYGNEIDLIDKSFNNLVRRWAED